MKIKLLILIIILGLVSSCQEDIIPDQPFIDLSKSVTIARSGDGTELKAITAKDNEGKQVVLYRIDNVQYYDSTFKIRSWFTQDQRSFIRIVHKQDFDPDYTISYMGSFVDDLEKQVFRTNDLINVEIEYFDQDLDATIVREFLPYSSDKYLELFSDIL